MSIHGKWLSPLPLTYLSDHLLTVYHYMHGEWMSHLSLTPLCITFSVSTTTCKVSNYLRFTGLLSVNKFSVSITICKVSNYLLFTGLLSVNKFSVSITICKVSNYLRFTGLLSVNRFSVSITICKMRGSLFPMTVSIVSNTPSFMTRVKCSTIMFTMHICKSRKSQKCHFHD